MRYSESFTEFAPVDVAASDVGYLENGHVKVDAVGSDAIHSRMEVGDTRGVAERGPDGKMNSVM